MKQFFLPSLIVIISFLSCNNADTKKSQAVTPGNIDSSEKTAGAIDQVLPADSATMMKNWAAYMTPSDVHKMLASWNGKWQGDVSSWPMPGAAVQKSTITTINKMMLGNRYQQSTHTGKMMGMNFEGISTLAYDNGKKSFISTWIDNMGTGLMIMQGDWDDATKTLNFSGSMVDPVAGNGKEIPFRETLTVLDDKTQLMQMFAHGPDGKEFKTMEIKLSR